MTRHAAAVVDPADFAIARTIPAKPAPGRSFVVLSAPSAQAAKVRLLMNQVLDRANETGLDAVVRTVQDALSASAAPPPPPEPWRDTEAARWSAIRTDWLRAHSALPPAAIAKLAASTTVNPSALLNGWVAAKRVFAVQEGARRLYPDFQIGLDGQPKPAFRTLLTALDGALDGWPLAIWLTTPNAELDDWQTPLARIECDPDAVVAAARREVAPAEY